MLQEMGELDGTGMKPEQFSNHYVPINGDNRKAPRKAEQRGRTEPFDEVLAVELFRQGLDDAALAEALGITPKRAQNWRLRMGLKRPSGGGHRKKEQPQETEETMEQAREPAETAMEKEKTTGEEPAGGMTVKAFLEIFTLMLAPGMTKAELLLNGETVRTVSELRLGNRDGKPCVDVRWEG